MFAMNGNPVLDVGGTHVTAALVDTGTWSSRPGTRHRLPLRSEGTTAEIIETIARCAQTLGPLTGTTLTVAIPGPFDYARGIGRYEGVAKFDALNGVDVRARLLDAIPSPPDSIEFLNDAAAFGIGEWVGGSATDCRRSVAVTLGTGVGSAFIDSGVAVDSGPLVPAGGEVHFLQIDGRPLEDVMSRRAIIAAYRRHAIPDTAAAEEIADLDVREIAGLAASGDHAALRALQEPCQALGVAISPWLKRFEAEILVVGGGLTASWSLIEPPLRNGVERGAPGLKGLPIVRSRDPEESVERGAAWFSQPGQARETARA